MGLPQEPQKAVPSFTVVPHDEQNIASPKIQLWPFCRPAAHGTDSQLEGQYADRSTRKESGRSPYDKNRAGRVMQNLLRDTTQQQASYFPAAVAAHYNQVG